jgi:hypothetical protein
VSPLLLRIAEIARASLPAGQARLRRLVRPTPVG